MLNILGSFGYDYVHPYSLILLLGDKQCLSLKRFDKLPFWHFILRNLSFFLSSIYFIIINMDLISSLLQEWPCTSRVDKN